MKTRDSSIDIIKIVASFSVVCLHVIDIPVNGVEQIIYYLSGCAIPLLFMTNGYLLLNKQKITFSRQLTKTLQMLGIVFAWCFIYSCINYFNKNIWVNPIEITYLGLIQKGPMWQFWFLGSLMIIHLFLPIIHKIFKQPKLAILITACFFVICFGMDMINISSAFLEHPLIQQNIPQTFRLWNHFAYFLLGGYLGKIDIKNKIKEISLRKHALLLAIMTFVIVIYQVNMGLSFYGTTYAEFFYDNFLIMVWIILLFSLLNRVHIANPKINKVISSISVNTFGVYAMHLYLLQILRVYYGTVDLEFVIWIPIFMFVITNLISQLLKMNKYTRKLITF